MLTTPVLFLALGLAPAQAGQLTLSNDRFTFGHLGSAREGTQFLPGDVLFLSFDIENLKFDADGKASYSVGMEVLDSKGEAKLRQEPRNMAAFNYLGGTALPAVATVQVGLEQAPGPYTLKVTVNDLSAKSNKTLERKFEIAPPGFGLIQVRNTGDPDGDVPTSPLAVVGETVFVNFAAAGFGRDMAKKQPNLTVEMRILDEQGKATTPKPVTGQANSGIAENLKIVPMQFALTLNRPGKFTIELTATDKISGKTSKVSLPITVMAVK